MFKPKPLPALVTTLKYDEGLSLSPYKCPAGKLTIGYGRNLEANGITIAEAELMLRNDCDWVLQSAKAMMKKWDDIDHYRQVAIANMIYQLGAEGFRKFATTRKHIDNRNWEAAYASANASLWAKQTPRRAARVTYLLLTGKPHEEYDL